MAAVAAVPWSVVQGKVLVASSHSEFRRKVLEGLGLTVPETTEASGGADALLKLEENDFRTLLIDSHLEDLNADELVSTIRERYPLLKVVLLDAARNPQQLSLEISEDEPRAREAATERADRREFAPEPVLALGLGTADSIAQMPHIDTAHLEPLPGMIGTSAKMLQLYRLARLVAPRDTAVLIVGGTGTGKELVARGIHALSRRSQKPFIVVNCAAIPEALLEAELFGYTRGAFTGAFQARVGRIHAAHGGTLLLDEVGELPLSMQAKLLRFVQEGEVQRLGSTDLFRVDTRLIAATNADLLQRVKEKQFREDLYYRLAVFPLEMPALCSRPEDIVALAHHFLRGLCLRAEIAPKVFTPEATHVLRKHAWPGNVRELQHLVERAFVLAEANDEITADDLAIR
jgi:DNA-binding NtrC family response regulator